METHNLSGAVADEVVELANKLAEANPDADQWEIADGLLSGAIHWWLYANMPCDDPHCEDCANIKTAALRMKTLQKLLVDMAESSEYYHSPNDSDVARA